MLSGTPRVWLLTNTPSPYQRDLLEAVERSGKVSLSVRFLEDTHRGDATLEGTSLADVRVLSSVREELQPQAHDLYVLSGMYTSRAFMQCARLLHRHHRRWAVWLEAPWPEDYRPPWATRTTARYPWLLPLRRLALRFLTQRATLVWAIGTAASEAYADAGVPPAKLHLLPYAADTSRFRSEADSNLRETMGLSGKTVFLFSGSLVPRKGVDLLLEAYATLCASNPGCALVLLGDGPLRDEVSQAAKSHPGIIAPGHVKQSELPDYFHAADVFVFPSRYDGWGMVVQEACAAGLPVLSTHHVGAARDLIRDGVNGVLIPRDDVTALARAMADLAGNPEKRVAMGGASREQESGFGIDAGVQRFLDGVTRCFEDGESR